MSDRFAAAQAELATCQVLVDAERDADVAACYREFVDATRRIAGAACREAWESDPIGRDEDMSLPEVAEQLRLIDGAHDGYKDAIRKAARTVPQRLGDVARS